MKQIILVTGANRGLGLESVNQLAQKGHKVLLSSRNLGQGQNQVNKLKREGKDVDFIFLDLNNPHEFLNVKEQIADRYGALDVLINNAAIHYDQLNDVTDPNFQIVEEAIQTNLLNTWKLTVALLPLIRKSTAGKIVNVSSGSGALTDMDGGTPAYSISKAGLNVLTIKLALKLKSEGILVNSTCPGWVRTDMGGVSAPRSIQEGAKGIVWAATLPKNGPTGGFFRDGQPIAW